MRGSNGFVVAPPSVRKDGAYRWLNDAPVAHAPAWLIALARKRGADRHGAADLNHAAPPALAAYNKGRGTTDDPDDLPTPPTPEEVRAALAALDPDCDYETWMRVGAATCKEFADEFVAWSATGSKFPGERECREKAKEFATMTQINLATLFHFATESDPDWRDYIGF